MTLSFPPSPTSGQTYQNWQWDGAKWVPYAAPSVIVTSGNRVLLSKQTVSTAVASVNFAGLLTSTYDLYEVDLYGVQFSANSIGIAARFSSDGGTTWIATASYNYGGWYTGAQGTAAGAQGVAQTMMWLSNGLDSIAVVNAALAGRIRISHALSTALYKFLMADTTLQNATIAPARYSGVGSASLTTAMNSIQFLPSSAGNITAGTFALYGIKP